MRHFPLFDLRITTPRLELRLPSLDDLDVLGDRAAEGIHDAGFMPFLFPWTDGTPEQRAQRTIQYQFRTWGALTPEDWGLEFAVVFEGEPVGFQGIMAKDFAIRREVLSGSWLGRRFHGRGIGTEMRAAVLQLAFHGLGAQSATTEAFEDNASSLAVTRKLGYREDGVSIHARQGERVINRRFRLAVQDWTSRPEIEIHGLEACLPMLGAKVA